MSQNAQDSRLKLRGNGEPKHPEKRHKEDGHHCTGELRLENQLCFPLYACSRQIVKKYKPFLDDLDLTYTQYITMMVMWERKQMSVKELGECLFLDSGTLTPLLKKLEQKGWVTRQRAREDERVLIVTLTESGERLRSRAVDIPSKMSGCVALSQDEADTLYQLLYKILSCSCEGEGS